MWISFVIFIPYVISSIENDRFILIQQTHVILTEGCKYSYFDLYVEKKILTKVGLIWYVYLYRVSYLNY